MFLFTFREGKKICHVVLNCSFASLILFAWYHLQESSNCVVFFGRDISCEYCPFVFVFDQRFFRTFATAPCGVSAHPDDEHVQQGDIEPSR